jgi:hypothetical protein
MREFLIRIKREIIEDQLPTYQWIDYRIYGDYKTTLEVRNDLPYIFAASNIDSQLDDEIEIIKMPNNYFDVINRKWK